MLFNIFFFFFLSLIQRRYRERPLCQRRSPILFSLFRSRSCRALPQKTHMCHFPLSFFSLYWEKNEKKYKEPWECTSKGKGGYAMQRHRDGFHSVTSRVFPDQKSALKRERDRAYARDGPPFAPCGLYAHTRNHEFTMRAMMRATTHWRAISTVGFNNGGGLARGDGAYGGRTVASRSGRSRPDAAWTLPACAIADGGIVRGDARGTGRANEGVDGGAPRGVGRANDAVTFGARGRGGDGTARSRGDDADGVALLRGAVVVAV